jgi:holo-[acyl-carrier protein] synthase
MKVIGHGIDLADTHRVAALIERHGDHFLTRVFSKNERQYCEANVKRRMEHYAARFAAKEAALKAIGTGWTNGIAWTDVEVIRQPSGQPELRVHGKVAEIAGQLGVRAWTISISHTETTAMASVIATA